jgi:hypothetical protein
MIIPILVILMVYRLTCIRMDTLMTSSKETEHGKVLMSSLGFRISAFSVQAV